MVIDDPMQTNGSIPPLWAGTINFVLCSLSYDLASSVMSLVQIKASLINTHIFDCKSAFERNYKQGNITKLEQNSHVLHTAHVFHAFRISYFSQIGIFIPVFFIFFYSYSIPLSPMVHVYAYQHHVLEI